MYRTVGLAVIALVAITFPAETSLALRRRRPRAVASVPTGGTGGIVQRPETAIPGRLRRGLCPRPRQH